MAVYTTIDDPSAYFKVQLYTGNGSANHAITFDDTDTDMQPDLVWIKNRDATDSHCLFDAVRGATKVIHPDAQDAETTDTDTLDSFTSDGFQVDADVKVNTNTEKYVAWCWKANGTGSSNTDGSINTTATSANTTAGFSIVNYTGTGSGGATIGHGLGLVPDFIVTKNTVGTGGAGDWHTFHGANTSAPETDYLMLNEANATTDHNQRWNDTMPTTTLVTFGDDSGTNQSGSSIMAYIWSSIQGFSKFGTYGPGNAAADGPFIYTGFKPAYLLIKITDAASIWVIQDNKRPGYNLTNIYSAANTTTAEPTNLGVDMLANGFKIRDADTEVNGSGKNYVYAAFAEAPFVNSNGVPCTAK